MRKKTNNLIMRRISFVVFCLGLFIAMYGLVSSDWSVPLSLNLSNNLTGYYALNSTTNDTVDSAGNDNNGTAVNGTILGAKGIIGTSYFFDGVNDYLNLTHPTSVCIKDNICSLSLWYNSTSTAPKSIWYEGNITNPFNLIRSGISLGVDDGSTGEIAGSLVLTLVNEAGLQQTVGTNQKITTGNLTHIAIVGNGTSYLFYVNGTLVNQSAVTYTIAQGILEIFMAYPADTTVTQGYETESFEKGQLDEIGLWNRSLSAEEVQALYNGGAGRAYFSGANNYLSLGEYWKNITAESASDFFQINITIPPTNTISQAKLVHNNTFYPTSINQIAGDNYSISATITQPEVVANVGVGFAWNITYSDGENFLTDNRTQNITNIGLSDSCGAGSLLRIVNYSAKDEDDLSSLNGVANNVTVEVDLTLSTLGTENNIAHINKTFQVVNQTNPAQICITDGLLNNSNFRMDVITKYSSTNRVTEYYNIQNYTLNNNTAIWGINTINLFDLLSTTSQEFLITYKDSNFIPVQNALIEMQRQYVGDGVFRIIEVPKTDADGRTIGHFVLNDIIYNIYVKKNGVLLATFSNVRAFCSNTATGDCRINLNAQATGNQLNTLSNLYNVSYGFDFNKATRTATLVFSTTDGNSKTFDLNITQYDAYQNQTLCSNSITANSGTLSCTIPQSFGNVTAIGKVFVDGQLLTSSIFDLGDNLPAVKKLTIYFLAFLLIVSLPLFAFTSGAGMIIFFFVGLIIAGTLAIVGLGGFVGPLSAFLWFVIAGGILLWKMHNRD